MTLQPGSSLVFYTDGVTDQGPGFERSPVHALGSLTAEHSAAALADALLDEPRTRAENPGDDVAIVALRYIPSTGGLEAERGLTVGTAAA